MGLLSKFENKMEDGIEGAAGMVGRSSLSPVQITKKAEKQMRREKIVGAGKQYAPTLYTVLVSPDDDSKLFKYYPTLAGEVETFLVARANELGYMMDGSPLVRFISDPELKRGKFDVVAEMVAASIIEQLRDDEMRRYGLPTGGAGRRRGSAGAMAAQRARGNLQPEMKPLVNLQPPEEEPEIDLDEGLDGFSDPRYANRGGAAGAAGAAAGMAGGMAAGMAAQQPGMGGVGGMGGAQAQMNPQQAAYAQRQAAMRQQQAAQGMQQNMQQGMRQQGGAQAGMAGAGASVGAGVDAGAGAQAAHGAHQHQHQHAQNQQFAQMQAHAQDPQQIAQAQQASYAAGSSSQDASGLDAQSLGSVRTVDFDDQPQAGQAGQAGQFTPAIDVYLYDEARDRVYTLTGASQRIGRESANDLVVPDINISRVHAEIHRETNGAWVISDLGSTNGLYINGRKVDSALLRDADMITLGTTTLEFQNLS